MIFRIQEANLLEYLELQLTPDCIVLFGSASRGEDTEESDVDIFVQAEQKDVNMKKFEKKLKRKIQLHMIGNINTHPEELRANIANGTVLYGFLDIG